jgi:hypothetical protein
VTTDLFAPDPTITTDELDEAHAAAPIDYEEVFAAIAARFAQDDIATDGVASLAGVVPNTPPEALAHSRGLHDNNVDVGVGYCLRTVHDDYAVPALWPDAETAWEHGGVLGKTRHREADPTKFPRGSIGYCVNGRHGHVFLCCGGDLCWTTDYRRLGRVDLAPISAMAPWVGGRLVGWAEILNGYDVWPDPKKPPTPPVALTLVEREKLVHNALERAIANHRGKRRIAGLRAWDEKLLERIHAA